MKKLFTLLLILTAFAVNTFAINITFMVSMKGSGVEYDSVFIVGEQTDWEFVQMEDQGDSLFSVSINMNEGDSAAFYFITIGWWDPNYTQYRENVPEECDYSAEYAGWDGDRGIVAPGSPTTFAYTWGSCAEPELPSGTNDIGLTGNLELFPNPSNDLVHIKIPDSGEYSSIDVITLSGNVIRNYSVPSGEVDLDVSDLTKGIYLIRISGNNETIIKKLIVN